jgi:hypothetical protein
MTQHDDRPLDIPRRSVLRRGAAVAAVAWSAPVVHSLTTPAHADGSPEPPTAGPTCFAQSFVIDKYNQPLVYTPGTYRYFDVDLGVEFSDVTSVHVRLYESPADALGPEHEGSVMFKLEHHSGYGGVTFDGAAGDPTTVGLSPTGGFPPLDTYEEILRDGRAELLVSSKVANEDSFTLLEVEIEVCGTPA